MASFSFKSSGITSSERESTNVDASPLPIGMRTPLQLASDDGLFVMHTAPIEQVIDNFRNLLQTNWGERLGLYNVGANLRPLLSDWVSLDDFESQAMQRISEAVQRWMPYINLGSFTARLENERTSSPTVSITIELSVPALGVVNRRADLSLRVM